MTKSFEWTETAVSDLQRLFAEGMSAAKIAVEIGAPTRNTVIGKIARMGLIRLKPVKQAKPANVVKLAPVKAVPTPKKSKALPPDGAAHREERRERFQAVADKALERFDAALPVTSEPVRFLDRGHFQCAMPQPGWESAPVAEKMVCGQPVQAGTSWCPACLKIVAAPSNFAAFKHRKMVGGIAA